MEEDWRVCCCLFNSSKEHECASSPLQNHGARHRRTELLMLSADPPGYVCPWGSGPPTATTWWHQPLLWHRGPAKAEHTTWWNAVQLLQALPCRDCPDGHSTGNIPICSPKSFIICETNSSLSLASNVSPLCFSSSPAPTRLDSS